MKKCLMLLLLITLILITGCGKISTEDSVREYLKKKFPNQNFTISYNKKITISKTSGGCGNTDGNIWNIKSLNNNFSFIVFDSQRFNSFTCDYELRDDYFGVYLNNLIKNDYRIKLYNSSDGDLKYAYVNGVSIDTIYFNSINELAELAYSIANKFKNDNVIESLKPEYFSLQICTNGKIIDTIRFSEITSKNYIINALHDVSY